MILRLTLSTVLLIAGLACLSFSGKRSGVPVYEKYMPAGLSGDELVRHKAYSLCYADEYEQSRCVAYLLTSTMCECAKLERTNKFIADKSVTSGSAKPADYLKSGYDRGHLCPAGDMAWDPIAMKESFLMSNMSPQTPGFNRGIWKSLEEQVREWAHTKGALVVMTGGVLKPGLPVIKGRVAVPELYYKIIADTSRHLHQLAFVLPNRSSKSPLKAFVVTVDSVETLTGLDFFSIIPDSVENYLESRVDTAAWVQ